MFWLDTPAKVLHTQALWLEFRGTAGVPTDVHPRTGMPDHPQYAMWKERREAERAAERERAERRALREASKEGWVAAWLTYRKQSETEWARMPPPPWWNLLAWARIIFAARRRSA
jgi:hypothetical protein